MKPILATSSVVRNLLNSKVGAWPAEPIDVSKPFQWQDRRPSGWEPYCDGYVVKKQKTCAVEFLKGHPQLYSPFAIGDIIYVRETFCGEELSRIHLEVMRVRVERACDISEEDARAEGCCNGIQLRCDGDHRPIFKVLWQSIYGPDAWEKWCWVYDLKRVR